MFSFQDYIKTIDFTLTDFIKIAIQNQNYTKQLLKSVLENVASLNEKVDKIMKNSTRDTDLDQSHEPSEFVQNLPVKSNEDLEELEKTLMDKSNQLELVRIQVNICVTLYFYAVSLFVIFYFSVT